METLTREQKLAILVRDNPGEKRQSLDLYLNTLEEYEKAQANIAENGTVVAHPRTEAPIPNPYLDVRDNALSRLTKTWGHIAADGLSGEPPADEPQEDETGPGSTEGDGEAEFPTVSRSQPARAGSTKRGIPPKSLGHQKLLAARIGCAELARMTGASKMSCSDWINKGTKPKEKFQTRMRENLGIQWADWDRKPVPPEERDGPELPLEPDFVPPPEEPEHKGSKQAEDSLEATLEEVQRQRRGAQPGSQAAAALLAQESRLIERIGANRRAEVTEQQKLLSCPRLQGWYRVAAEVLRPELGDKWPELVKRIGRAWDAVGDDGELPEGFEP